MFKLLSDSVFYNILKEYTRLFLFNSTSSTPGPSYSKLTTSLVNISLELWLLNMAYALLCFAGKKSDLQKLLTFFFQKKYPWIRYCTRTVYILTTNELDAFDNWAQDYYNRQQHFKEFFKSEAFISMFNIDNMHVQYVNV